MMRIVKIISICALLAMAGNALADELRVEPVAINPGEQVVIDVKLLNPNRAYIMAEFYLSLPQGVTIAQDEDGELLCEPNGARFDRTHQLVVEQGTDGQYHFLIYSNRNKALKGTEGTLFTMTLQAAAGMAQGRYEGRIFSQIFSDENKTEHNPADVTFTVSVGQAGGLTLHLTEGWNWVSSPLREPLALDGLKQACSRIVSQTEELVNDPQMGWVGTITALQPGQGYKVLATEETTLTLSGEESPAMPLSLAKGWNWVGFAVADGQALGTAVSGAEQGDRIVAEDGREATYSGGQWTGTLTTLQPGKGYLYCSVSAKTVE